MKTKTCSFCQQEVEKLYYANPKTCYGYQCRMMYHKQRGTKIDKKDKPDIDTDESEKVAKSTVPRAKSKRIKPVSDKQAERLKEYRIIRDKFIQDNPTCMYPECSKQATDLHHAKGRVGNLLTDIKWFKSLCREHHIFIEENPTLAKEMGLSFSRLSDQC